MVAGTTIGVSAGRAGEGALGNPPWKSLVGARVVVPGKPTWRRPGGASEGALEHVSPWK